MTARTNAGSTPRRLATSLTTAFQCEARDFPIAVVGEWSRSTDVDSISCEALLRGTLLYKGVPSSCRVRNMSIGAGDAACPSKVIAMKSKNDKHRDLSPFISLFPESGHRYVTIQQRMVSYPMSVCRSTVHGSIVIADLTCQSVELLSRAQIAHPCLIGCSNHACGQCWYVSVALRLVRLSRKETRSSFSWGVRIKGLPLCAVR